MTTKQQQIERRTNTQSIASKLMAERQEMLVHYCKLAGLEPFSKDSSVDEELRKFCEALVDYLAFVHFEIYDRIGTGQERRTAVIDIAEKIYPLIKDLTTTAVEFNDKYDESDHQIVLNHLSDDLSGLGEELASCMEQEDRLLAALVN